jgi:hypothetical protein
MPGRVNDYGRVVISVVVVIGFIGITVIYMTRKLEGAPVPELLSILLGSLATNFTSVVGYWIGSSSSSSSKDDTIQNMAAKVPTVPVIMLGFLLSAAMSKAYLVLA